MHIGLIGGIGPAATDLYYRGLIDEMKRRGKPLDATIVHADAPTLVRNFEAREPGVQAQIFAGLTVRLKAAGAEAVAITSIGGHFCVNEFRPLSVLPVLDMIAAMNAHMTAQNYTRVGLLGTDTVMLTGFYGGLTEVDVLAPDEADIPKVHRAYVDMALSAKVTPAQRDVFVREGRRLTERGAQTILLGGTDLFLAFENDPPDFAILDCAEVHVQALADAACS
ncbi:MAG: aspartate/glutamate racemase family protein [Pseudomonadota bacterium]